MDTGGGRRLRVICHLLSFVLLRTEVLVIRVLQLGGVLKVRAEYVRDLPCCEIRVSLLCLVLVEVKADN